MEKNGFGGIALIAGTCIGGGMLALPIITVSYGVVGAIFVSVLAWFLMYITGLMLLEVNLALGGNINFASMVKATLGKKISFSVTLLYLLLIYALVIAYNIGLSKLINYFLTTYFAVTLPYYISALLVSLLIGVLILSGIRYVDVVNRLCSIILVGTYAVIIIAVLRHLHVMSLSLNQATYFYYALPVVITSFGFHVIIPTLHDYYEGDRKKLKNILFWGTVLPLLIYLVWQLVIFALFAGKNKSFLLSLAHSSNQAGKLINHVSQFSSGLNLVLIFKILITSALITSFVGVMLSLTDFLLDLFSWKNVFKQKVTVLLCALIPSYIFSLLLSQMFMRVLAFAGIILLFLQCLIPFLMYMSVRKQQKKSIFSLYFAN